MPSLNTNLPYTQNINSITNGLSAYSQSLGNVYSSGNYQLSSMNYTGNPNNFLQPGVYRLYQNTNSYQGAYSR